MRHISLKMNSPIELIETTPLNPFISKCVIKVCYVGEQPNRNGTVITKEVAKEMANSLPGCPIVGFFNEEKEDFEGHERDMVFDEDGVSFKDITRPYGFIDLDARVWFEKFSDDGIEHEYLMTEGYLWTGQYPETKKILENGAGQSMELDPDLTKGHWAEGDNGKPDFFIINETLITKLCILGDDFEPCFEGASVQKFNFSLKEDFNESLLELMELMKEILKKGDTSMEDTNSNQVETLEGVSEVSELTYNLDEIPEYVELKVSYADLEKVKEKLQDELSSLQMAYEDVTNFRDNLTQELETIKAEYAENKALMEALTAENVELKTYKLNVEREIKQNMIAKFFMLSDEDKADVVENIDNYTLDEIEAKLSVIGVRKGINFSLQEEEPNAHITTYNVNNDESNATPSWINAVREIAKTVK